MITLWTKSQNKASIEFSKRTSKKVKLLIKKKGAKKLKRKKRKEKTVYLQTQKMI